MPSTNVSSEDTHTLLDQAEAFLLDYNGTLSKDEELCAELIDQVSAERIGATVSRARYYAEFAGCREEAVFAQLAAENGGSQSSPKELMDEFNRRYLARFAAEVTITENARAFVKVAYELGKRVMLVTAASRSVVVPALKISGISEYFSGVIGLEDVNATKPEPECYLRAVEVLGIDASRAVAFEDSHTGFSAALGAGLSVVGVLGTLDRVVMSEYTPHIVEGLHPRMLNQ